MTWSELSRRGYPGADAHDPDERAYVTVATTRPETYLGDTAVAVNPHDPRAKALRGMWVELPLVGRVIPIIEDSYVVLPSREGKYGKAIGLGTPSLADGGEESQASSPVSERRGTQEPEDPKAAFATGFLKVTPAHDPNDYELGQRHKLATINVMAPDASISDKHGWSDVGDAHIFVGKKREDARKLVVKEFEARGLLEDQKPYRHTVGHSDRSKAAIEPYLSDQWYVRVTDPRMAASANNALTPSQRSHAGSSATSARSGQKILEGSHGLEQGSHGPEEGGHGGKSSGHGLEQGSHGLEQGSHGPERGSHGRTPSGHGPAQGSHGQNQPRHTAGDGSLSFHPARYAKTYEGWHDNIRDWCISRQLWWGHRIPVWHRRLSTAEWGAPKRPGWSEADSARMSDASFALITPVGRWEPIPWDPDVLVHWEPEAGTEFECFICLGPEEDLQKARALEAAGFTQDPDVLDTWFSSALWPMSTMGWPLAATFTLHLCDPADEPGTAAHQEAHQAVAAYLKAAGVGDTVEIRGVAANGTAWLSVIAAGEAAMAAVERLAAAEFNFIQTEDRRRAFISENPHGQLLADAQRWIEIGRREDSAEMLRAFNPSSTLCTAREIITLWVSRMVMFNRYFLGSHEVTKSGSYEGKTLRDSVTPDSVTLGPAPFHDVFVHCVVQDGEGRKMSKSLGNGVDPLDIIASHGADAMRFTVCNMSTNTQDVRLPVKKDSVTGKNTSDKFDLGRNFANKVWNASRFALGILGTPTLRGGSELDSGIHPPRSVGVPKAKASLTDRWMLSRLATAVVEVESALKNFEFSSYAQTMYDLLWRDFCDWYLEAIKPTVAQDASQRAVLAATLDAILRLLHPIMPYVTEAIYEQVRGLGAATPAGVTLGEASKAGLLATAAWPKVDASLRDAAAEAEFEQLRAVITAIREVRAKHNVQPKRRPTLHVPKARLAHLRANETLVSTLAGLGTITDQPPAAGSPFVDFTSEGAEYKLSDMADAVDAGAEKARLTKLVADLEKSVATFEGRLANPGYAAKAPPAMVQQTKDQMEKAKAELVAARKALEGLA